VLYRLFPYDPEAGDHDEGGALHVPRLLQGAGRHDNPERYGVLYGSRAPVAVVAEFLRRFRDRPVTDPVLRWERGLPYALAALDESAVPALLDLDDPAVLSARELRPSEVATRRRRETQELALTLYGEGIAGFEWWSTIEASWINVTLFQDRAARHLRLARAPERLTRDHPLVGQAAEAVGVRLAG
jgi:hypothetical protein